MDDLEKYIEKRKKRSHEFAENFETGYCDFKNSLVQKQAPIETNITCESIDMH